MRHDKVQIADAALVDVAARQCGALAIGCAETGGEVTEVIGSVRQQIATLAALQRIMTSLEGDQRQVADATDEARILSDTARQRLSTGRDAVRQSSEDIAAVTALVVRFGARITSFASALEQVRRTTEVIDAIARTTNMLALNAAIEAERAGAVGSPFGVVADEVKKLARDTRIATDEVGATMASLTREAEAFVTEVQDGVARSRAAERSFAVINETMREVSELVEQVDHQSDDIAQAAGVIHQHVCRLGADLHGFAGGAQANDARLGETLGRMARLERDANEMFDTIVHSGFAHEDAAMVEAAVNWRDRFLALAEAALADGSLAEAALFDTDYRPIAGSDPARFDAAGNAFADRCWRPELDRVLASDPRVVSTACTDVNGYLPTHTTRYSRTPTGDRVHDAAYCRHRRILADAGDRIAKASTKPFHLSVFRREREDGGHDAVRNVYVPLIIRGRRWGDFEIAYRLG